MNIKQFNMDKSKTSKFVSINVNGLNCPRKRKRIFTQLRKLKVEIICLQETHIKETDAYLLQDDKLGACFYVAEENKKKRGVVEWKIKMLRQKEFEGTNKTGRLLAWC